MTERSAIISDIQSGTEIGKDGLFDQPFSSNKHCFPKHGPASSSLIYENLPAEMKEKMDKLKDIFHVSKLG